MSGTNRAFLLLNTDVSAEQEVLDSLNEIEEVKSAYLVYGVYDIIAELESESLDDIKTRVLDHVRSIDKIRSTVTMIVAAETS